MKLDSRMLSILKNFSMINPSIQFKEGKKLSTISPSKTLMATATLTNDIPKEFAIYDLSEFLGALSLFEDPEIDLHDNSMTIKSGKSRIDYVYASPETIVSAPSKKIELPDPVYTFTLTAEVFSKALRGLGIFKLPEIEVKCSGGAVTISATDSKNKTGHLYSEVVGTHDKDFNAIFRAENLKLLSGDYEVQICKGLAKFTGSDIEYYIAVEATSNL